MQAQQGISFCRATEITRDELKFAKFVSRLRKKFNMLFNDILKTQLILKGVLTEKDWDSIQEKIQYKYAQDQYFDEMKSAENYRNQLDLLNMVNPYVGTYFSKNFVMKNVLRMSDDEIKQMKKEIESEPPPQPVDPNAQQDQPGMGPGGFPVVQE